MPTRCNRVFFIADLIACLTCFGHHYAHHQELKGIIQWLLPVVFRAVKMSHNIVIIHNVVQTGRSPFIFLVVCPTSTWWWLIWSAETR